MEPSARKFRHKKRIEPDVGEELQIDIDAQAANYQLEVVSPEDLE